MYFYIDYHVIILIVILDCQIDIDYDYDYIITVVNLINNLNCDLNHDFHQST